MRFISKGAILLAVFSITSCVVYDREIFCETDVEILNNDIAKYLATPEYNDPSKGYYYFDEVKLKALENKCEEYVSNINNREDPTGASWGDILVSKAHWFVPVKSLHKGQKGRIRAISRHNRWSGYTESKAHLIKVYEK